MQENTDSDIHKREVDLLKDQFSKDVKEYLANRPNLSTKALLRQLGNVLDESSFRRNINKKTTPSPNTLRAFYSYVFQEDRDEILLELVPPIIKNNLLLNFKISNLPKSNGDESRYIDNQITSDYLFSELYTYTAFDNGTSLKSIQEEFGKRAMRVVNEMIAKDILKLDTKTNQVYPGRNRATYSHEVICELAKTCISQVQLHPEIIEGQRMNYVNFQDLNSEGLNALIQIEDDAYKKKLKVINNSIFQGKIKVFTLGFTDYITNKDNNYPQTEPQNVH